MTGCDLEERNRLAMHSSHRRHLGLLNGCLCVDCSKRPPLPPLLEIYIHQSPFSILWELGTMEMICLLQYRVRFQSSSGHLRSCLRARVFIFAQALRGGA